MTKYTQQVAERPMLERATVAMKVAVEKAIQEHARNGMPIYVWQDGNVVEISAEEVRRNRNGESDR